MSALFYQLGFLHSFSNPMRHVACITWNYTMLNASMIGRSLNSECSLGPPLHRATCWIDSLTSHSLPLNRRYISPREGNAANTAACVASFYLTLRWFAGQRKRIQCLLMAGRHGWPWGIWSLLNAQVASDNDANPKWTNSQHLSPQVTIPITSSFSFPSSDTPFKVNC